MMFRSRRDFLVLASGWIAVTGPVAALAQGPSRPSPFPDPFGRRDPWGDDAPRPDPRRRLAANDAEIKKNVTRLSELVSQLQKDIEKSDTKDVLPVSLIRQTEEIEKVARRIKDLLRG